MFFIERKHLLLEFQPSDCKLFWIFLVEGRLEQGFEPWTILAIAEIVQDQINDFNACMLIDVSELEYFRYPKCLWTFEEQIVYLRVDADLFADGFDEDFKLLISPKVWE